jgi:sarcosine oxidase, subunit delta
MGRKYAMPLQQRVRLVMQLKCPHCGSRAEGEFRCGGTTAIARPPLDCSDEVWGTYLYFRDNPKGAHAERWCHTFGCGLWFNVLRDTVTHEVTAVCGITEAPQELAP